MSPIYRCVIQALHIRKTKTSPVYPQKSAIFPQKSPVQSPIKKPVCSEKSPVNLCVLPASLVATGEDM